MRKTVLILGLLLVLSAMLFAVVANNGPGILDEAPRIVSVAVFENRNSVDELTATAVLSSGGGFVDPVEYISQLFVSGNFVPQLVVMQGNYNVLEALAIEGGVLSQDIAIFDAGFASDQEVLLSCSGTRPCKPGMAANVDIV